MRKLKLKERNDEKNQRINVVGPIIIKRDLQKEEFKKILYVLRTKELTCLD